MAVLASIFVFLAIALFTVAVLRPRGSSLRSQMRWLKPIEGEEELPDLSRPLAERVLWPTLEGLGRGVVSLLPAALLARLREALTAAGSPVGVPGLLLFSGGSAFSLTLLYVLILGVSRTAVGPQQVLLAVLLAGLGATFPFIWLRMRIQSRRKLILRSLPDAFDLLTASVEAGLAIDAALAKVAERMEGPFAEELSQVAREMSLGRTRRDALRALGQRTGVPELISFVNAIIQAEQMGVSLGQVLRAQAEQMRIHRRQRAEAEAQRAPVKLLFPLVLGVLPSIFIVVLGPAVINIYDVLIDR